MKVTSVFFCLIVHIIDAFSGCDHPSLFHFEVIIFNISVVNCDTF